MKISDLEGRSLAPFAGKFVTVGEEKSLINQRVFFGEGIDHIPSAWFGHIGFGFWKRSGNEQHKEYHDLIMWNFGFITAIYNGTKTWLFKLIWDQRNKPYNASEKDQAKDDDDWDDEEENEPVKNEKSKKNINDKHQDQSEKKQVQDKQLQKRVEEKKRLREEKKRLEKEKQENQNQNNSNEPTNDNNQSKEEEKKDENKEEKSKKDIKEEKTTEQAKKKPKKPGLWKKMKDGFVNLEHGVSDGTRKLFDKMKHAFDTLHKQHAPADDEQEEQEEENGEKNNESDSEGETEEVKDKPKERAA